MPAATAAGAERPMVTVRADHPRLLLTAENQRRIEKAAKTDPLLARLIEQNHVNATAMLTQSRVRYEIPDGKRLLSQSRKCIERVAAMAMAYRLSGERKFADSAITEMLVVTKFKDFNPSHFLDTAEMTTALAIGYDWLFDVISAEDRATIREAIVRLGLRPGMKVYESAGWWSRGDNNWNQVCNGGMILGSLAIAEDEPEFARTVIRGALASIPAGVSVYDPDGAYPEGPGYWQYGTAYTCVTIAALETAMGTDFGIAETPGLDRTGAYRIHTIGPTGAYFNYADCGSGSRPASAMFVLSKTFDRPLYAWWHRQRLAGLISAEGEIRPARRDRFFPLEIALYDARGETPTAEELPLDALFQSRQDVGTMRSRWGDPEALYIGFKGGDNRTNHGHLDIGSFVLDAGGVRWAIDLGSDNYNMPGYFGGNRWKYFRMTNHSHNTLVIGEKIQNTSAKAQVIAFHAADDRAAAVVDMTDAYRDQATSARRGIEMFRTPTGQQGGVQAVRVQDEIVGAAEEICWRMVTAAEIELDGSRAVLNQAGKKLQATIRSPAGATFEILSTKPPTDREKQNQGTRILAVRTKPDGDRPVTIDVVLRPIGDGDLEEVPPSRPLAQWPGAGVTP